MVKLFALTILAEPGASFTMVRRQRGNPCATGQSLASKFISIARLRSDFAFNVSSSI